MNVSHTATCYINGKSDSAPYLLADQLISLLCHSHSRSAAPVFLCIGTDLVTGDSLGPLVGTWLHCSSAFPYTVYGTLSQPVHAMNLKETMSKVSFSHPDSPVIAIDACLGSKKHLHYITIAPGALSPGAGVNKCPRNGGGYLHHRDHQSLRRICSHDSPDHPSFCCHGNGRMHHKRHPSGLQRIF